MHNSCIEDEALSLSMEREPNILGGDKDLAIKKSLQSSPNHDGNELGAVINTDKDTISNSDFVKDK